MTITLRKPGSAAIPAKKIEVPPYLRQVVEEIAFQAREDNASTALRRQPASPHHHPRSLVSSAEQRAARNGEKAVVAASPTFTPPFPPSPANWSLNMKASSKARTPSPANSSHRRRPRLQQALHRYQLPAVSNGSS